MTLLAQGLTEVRTIQKMTVAVAIRMRVMHGVQVNRDYTPKNLLALTGKWLGKSYGRTELMKAGKDLYTHLGMEWK